MDSGALSPKIKIGLQPPVKVLHAKIAPVIEKAEGGGEIKHIKIDNGALSPKIKIGLQPPVKVLHAKIEPVIEKVEGGGEIKHIKMDNGVLPPKIKIGLPPPVKVGYGKIAQVSKKVIGGNIMYKEEETEPYYLVTTEKETENMVEDWEDGLIQDQEKITHGKEPGSKCVTIQITDDGTIQRTTVTTKGDTTTTVTEKMKNGISIITRRVSRGGRSTSSVKIAKYNEQGISTFVNEAEIIEIKDILNILQKDGSVLQTIKTLKDGKAEVSKERNGKMPMHGNRIVHIKRTKAKQKDGTTITTVITTEVSKEATILTKTENSGMFDQLQHVPEGKILETVLTIERGNKDGTISIEEITTKEGKTTVSRKTFRGKPIQTESGKIHKDTKKVTVLKKDGSIVVITVIHEWTTITVIRKIIKGDITKTTTHIRKNHKIVQTSQAETKTLKVVNKDGSTTMTTETKEGKKVTTITEVIKGSIKKITKTVTEDGKPLKDQEEWKEISTVTKKDGTSETTTVTKKGDTTIIVVEVTKGYITTTTTTIKIGERVIKTFYYTSEEEIEDIEETSPKQETVETTREVNKNGMITITTITTNQGKTTVTSETVTGIKTEDMTPSTTKTNKVTNTDGTITKTTETKKGKTITTTETVKNKHETKTTVKMKEGDKPEETKEEIVEKTPTINQDGSIIKTKVDKKGDTTTTITEVTKGDTTSVTTEVTKGNKVVKKTEDIIETSSVIEKDGTTKTTTITKQGDTKTTVTKVTKEGKTYEQKEVTKGGKPIEKTEESTEKSTVVDKDGTSTTTTVTKKGDTITTVTDVTRGETTSTTTTVKKDGKTTTT
ncbi:hypothetical protein JZ751_026291, partial [Albula glossodonta]